MKRWIVALLVVAAIVGLALAPLPIDDTTRIHTTVSIDRDPDAGFAYVTTPANWPKWHPSSLAVSGATDHPLDLGDRVPEQLGGLLVAELTPTGIGVAHGHLLALGRTAHALSC